jgi:alkylhydroperoxidase family enzyme
MLVLKSGMSPERIAELDDAATSNRYTDDERAALAYADAMVATPVEVTDEQVADLAGRFGEEGLVELTYAVALEQLRSRFNTALGITAQGFAAACSVSSRD